MKKFSQIMSENLVYDDFGNAQVIEMPDIRELIMMGAGVGPDYFGTQTGEPKSSQNLGDASGSVVPEVATSSAPEEVADVPGWVHSAWHDAPKYTFMQAVEVTEDLNYYYDLGLEDEYDDDDEMEVPKEFQGDEYEEDMEESFRQSIEHLPLHERTILTTQMRRKRAWKKKKKKILGKRVHTKTFKRTHRFDHKKKKFVKRKKALKASALKKKARIFKRVVRKGSTKAAAKRSKRRFGGKALPRV
jgi:hypothetical protein